MQSLYVRGWKERKVEIDISTSQAAFTRNRPTDDLRSEEYWISNGEREEQLTMWLSTLKRRLTA